MPAVLKIAAVVGVIATVTLWARIEAPPDQITYASFGFDRVSYSSPVLGGVITPEDLATIEAVARAELAAAFQGLRISITDRRDVRYHVRVVQEVPGPPLTRKTWVAGSSYAVPGFGGSGEVNFTYFASGALVFAPPQATRSELIEGIGRGIGRGAVHEFAHQFLSGDALHNTRDRASYEWHAASRAEQYYGPMHWDHAGPLLVKRFGYVQAEASQDERLIRETRARSNAAIAAHDLAGIARAWLPDIHVVSSTSVQTAGADANQQRMARQFENRPDTVYVRTTRSVEVFAPWNVASERGEWIGRWTEPDGKVEIGGTYQAQWRNIDGRWLIQAELYVPLHCRGSQYCSRRP